MKVGWYGLVGLLVIVAGVALFWFSEQELGNSFFEESVQHERVYPNTIAGLWEPSPPHLADALQDPELESLGVNTIHILAEYFTNREGELFMRDERRLPKLIDAAHTKGYAVVLVPSFVQAVIDPRNPSDLTAEEVLDLASSKAIEWATVAEEHKVEFFIMHNELDLVLDNVGLSREESVEVVSSWHQEMLPQVQEVFSGKVIAKVDDFHQGYDFSSYELVGVTVHHQNEMISRFSGQVGNELLLLDTAAQEQGFSWYIAEAWMPFGGEHYPEEYNVEGELLSELQDDYLALMFNEYFAVASESEHARGVSVISWNLPSSEIKGRDAQKVVENNFAKLVE